MINPSTMQRLLAPLSRKLKLLVGRCVLSALDNTKQRQNVQLQLLNSELADNVEHFQPGGFTSVPLNGATGLYIAMGGKRSSLAAFCLENKEKRLMGLNPGEAAIYNIAEGHHLVLKENGIAELICKQLVVTAETKINFNTPKAIFSGEVDISGKLVVSGTSAASDHVSDGISGKTHTHKGGKITSPPLGA